VTTGPDSPDLLAMAQEAEVEIVAAEALVVDRGTLGDGPSDAASGYATAELGYYEAELRSLRSAATGLDAAERHTHLP
jgi:hypothetical protein